ncbi:saccharopine dehydrogenase NADP-binding domain-containing protein [Trinickia sp. NRRL B-1857]|uniref:saccharopine dehydrogenase NADP-binding domain-containing protein n=1 Tax=Trinickia sp. NRRL B-1857 TaxID=3162879 RepID=UPI003D272CC0
MSNRIVIVGFGNIGQAVAPLLQKEFAGWQISAIDCDIDSRRMEIAEGCKIELLAHRIDPDNFATILGSLVAESDFLLNLAPSVSTCDLLKFVQSKGAIYLDTGVEPWEYDYDGTCADTSNYALRERVLALKRTQSARANPTAIVASGANPGYVSALVKQGLLELAHTVGLTADGALPPQTRDDWARLACALDVQVIQVSEFDTQRAPIDRASNEFVNTWSVPGFITECQQDVELGWGTHEPSLPAGAVRQTSGSCAAIRLNRPGWATTVKSWTPRQGEFEAYVLTHHEAISIADYLTLGSPGTALYRPTVYYAYRPTDLAVESMSLLREGFTGVLEERLLKDEIVDGIDELGVFLLSGRFPSLWLGSALSIDRARSIAPYNNATSLQVASAVVAALRWASAHPTEGIVESDEIDYRAMIDYAEHFWAPMQRCHTDWKPIKGLTRLAFGAFSIAGEHTDIPATAVRSATNVIEQGKHGAHCADATGRLAAKA